ncbi:putative capsid protein [Beauveria bassiana RNA virus 1]|nr:putative capsid protein [Beauveria bassiana RNA virus 1]
MMTPVTRKQERADVSSVKEATQSAPGTATNTGATERPTSPAARRSSTPVRPQVPPDLEAGLTLNMVTTRTVPNHPEAVLRVLQAFLGARGVTTLPGSVRDLYPSNWRIGNTTIPVRGAPESATRLGEVLPHLRGFNAKGEEVHWISEGRDASSVVRLTAEWDSPVEIAAAILADVKDVDVSKDDVLVVAQRSPQALEQLKKSGKEFKEHVQRWLDPVALRRSPEFIAVSLRYKAQLRSLIDEQQKAIVAARKATAAVNRALGERDEALARLDPGYVPKRATAARALAEFGIDLDGDTEMDDAAGAASDALRDLDF